MLMTLDEAPSTVKSFATSAMSRPAMLREAGDLAVGGRLVPHLRAYAAREAAGLDEAARIDEVVDPLARVEQSLLLARGELLRAAHGERLGGVVFELLDQIVR